MTNREEEILNLIRLNPMISQKEISNKMGITRSSVAVHITNLMKKGYIKGKGYILKDEDYITVIGGANIDITGFPNSKLLLNDSNPGEVKLSLGGVGRNISENLSKLGVNVKLITAIGDDIYGNKLFDECMLAGIDMNDSLILNNNQTSIYLSTLDNNGDMKVAISAMEIINNITIDFIKSKSNIINNSKLVILDTNIDEEVINYIVKNYDVDIFIDTVSSIKSMKIKDNLGYFHTLKLNKLEAEKLTGIKLNNTQDIKKCVDFIINKGVNRVFITLGDEGVYYGDALTKNIIKHNHRKVINATGAGDAFMSGLVYSYLHDLNIHDSAKFGIACSILAISHQNTINPDISVENIDKILKEMI